MSDSDFLLSKKKNFDTISSARLDLSKISNRNFNTIIDNKYNFYNLFNMENFSKSITKEDIKKFFEITFNSKNALKFTVYVIKILFNFY